jgi:hypothetical protein
MHMSTRSGYDRIDTEQAAQHFAIVAVVLLSVLVAVLYLAHQLTELIIAIGSLLRV